MVMKISTFWAITACSLLKFNPCLGQKCRLHVQERRISQVRNEHEAGYYILRYVPPRLRFTFNKLYGVISQKTKSPKCLEDEKITPQMTNCKWRFVYCVRICLCFPHVIPHYLRMRAKYLVQCRHYNTKLELCCSGEVNWNMFNAKLEGLTAVTIKITIFWDETQYSLVDRYWRFGRTFSLIFFVEECSLLWR
jgi:hypothetical protein